MNIDEAGRERAEETEDKENFDVHQISFEVQVHVQCTCDIVFSVLEISFSILKMTIFVLI